MAHLITSDDYRFGRSHGERAGVRTRGALRRVSGFLKNMIEAIADSKMRRIERELELRGFQLRSTQQRLGGAQSWPSHSRGLIGHAARPLAAAQSRGGSHAPISADHHPLLVPCFGRPPAPSGRFMRSSWEGPVRKIPSGRPLYARSRTEMAGEATDAWARVARLNARR